MALKMEEQTIDIISKIVDLNELSISKDSNKKSVLITNKIDDQAIILQFTEDGIWVRLREPKSGYLCESIEEFKSYIKALMTNKIEVCVGTKNGKWVETIYVPTHNHDEMKEDLDYSISYWANPKNYD